MKSTCIGISKADIVLGQTKKHSPTTSGRTQRYRRRNLSSDTPSPTTRDNVSREMHSPPRSGIRIRTGQKLATHSTAHSHRPCSPPIARSSDLISESHVAPNYTNRSNRPLMPPGPPTSPVPSPPPALACPITSSVSSNSSVLTLDLFPDIIAEEYSTMTSSSNSLQVTKREPTIPTSFANRLRRRRNAICSASATGHGLKEFFASYVISHLTDSMTSSLRLVDSRTVVAEARRTTSVTQPPSMVSGQCVQRSVLSTADMDTSTPVD